MAGSSGSGGAGTGGSATGGSSGVGGAGAGGSATGGSSGVGGAGAGGSATGGSSGVGGAGAGGSATGGSSGVGGASTGGSATGGSSGTAGTGTGGSAAGGSSGSAGAGSCPVSQLVTTTDGFGIDATEVMQCQYEAWLATNPDINNQWGECAWNTSFVPSCSWPPSGNGDLPVVCVDWCDAVAYCESVGKRLCGAVDGGSADFYGYNDPNESEWFAACWNGEAAGSPPCNAAILGTGATVPVGSIADCKTNKTGYDGIFDLVGNVWEWEDSCDSSSSQLDQCHLRGGSFKSTGTQTDCGFGEEIRRDTKRDDIGFRCCSAN